MNNRQKLVQQQFLNDEEKVIKRLDTVYKLSLKDVKDKIQNLQFDIDKLQAEYDWLDPDDPAKAKIKSKIQSKIYQKQYQEQLHKQLDGIVNQIKDKQYLTVSDYLDGCYTDGFIGTIFDAHGQGVPIITPIDQQAMVRAVQLDSKISKGLYARLGEDVDLLKRKITAQVSRGISTGMSYAQVAKQLSDASRVGYNNAVRIARTEGHRIQTTASMDAMEAAKEKGADVVKQWDATLDSRTRESHAQVDGEIRELDKPFSNGLMYPGDPRGGAGEVVNCRCAILQRARWAIDEDELKTLQDRAAYYGLDKSEQFDDFKKKYLKATTTPDNKWGFNKIEGNHDIKDDSIATNPNYSRSQEYKINCQRCVPAYEMRRRGYDVEALPRITSGVDATAKQWENIFKDANWDKSVASNRYKTTMQRITDRMIEYGDGARAEIYVVWKGGSAAHVFVAENINGTVRFIDPQTGEINVEGYFTYIMPSKTQMLRMDNLEPSDLITGCCKNKETK